MAKRERPKPNVTFHYDGDMEELGERIRYLLAQSAAEQIMKSIAEDTQAGMSK